MVDGRPRQTGELAERPKRKWVIRSGKKLDWKRYADNIKIMVNDWLAAFKALGEEIRNIKLHRIDAGDAKSDASEVESAVDTLMLGIVDTARATLGVRRQQSSAGTRPWMTKEIQSKIDDFRAFGAAFNLWGRRKMEAMKQDYVKMKNSTARVCCEAMDNWTRMILEQEWWRSALHLNGGGAHCTARLSSTIDIDLSNSQGFGSS